LSYLKATYFHGASDVSSSIGCQRRRCNRLIGAKQQGVGWPDAERAAKGKVMELVYQFLLLLLEQFYQGLINDPA
jgi:hypothetical protein